MATIVGLSGDILYGHYIVGFSGDILYGHYSLALVVTFCMATIVGLSGNKVANPVCLFYWKNTPNGGLLRYSRLVLTCGLR